MLSKFKSAVNNVMTSVPVLNNGRSIDLPADQREVRFPYNRPEFLHLNWEEVQVSADHVTRPILVPRDVAKIPWNAGYAEAINGGKSKWNEDQSRAGTFFVRGTDLNGAKMPHTPEASQDSLARDFEIVNKDPLPFTYFAVFDGHAGTGASLMAANMLHNFIQERLQDVRELLIRKRYGLEDSLSNSSTNEGGPDEDTALKTGFILRQSQPKKLASITADELVVGALEAAFIDMDTVIAQERAQYRVTGGCTALVALFFLGKLYVANAGDCRAVILRGNEAIQISTDFTPQADRQRIQLVAKNHPHFLRGEFTRLEFEHRPTRKEIGQQVLYRDSHMTGWSYKIVQEEDVKIPLIYGEGKKARVLATIGVTRGFGDHDLAVLDTDILVKPFLTAQPEVQIYDLSKYNHTKEDVLVLGSDGLWDVMPNRKALQLVSNLIPQLKPDDPMRYTSVAQDLVMNARGLLRKGWRTADDLPASYDDITCFVIPLHTYGAPITQSSSTESSLETT